MALDGSQTRTLGDWLTAFSAASSKLHGVTAEAVVSADAEIAGLLPSDWHAESPITMEDIPNLLAAIESLTRADDAWAAHKGWLLTGDWAEDSRDLFIEELVQLLDLPAAPTPSADAPEDALLATFNGATARLGRAEQLHLVPNELGLTLVVKLAPSVVERLAREGLLDAALPEGPAPV